MSRQATVKTYESNQLNQVLGETLHPGGIGLTERMAEVAELKQTSAILDLGCGRGTSILFYARQHGCRGMGVDLSPVSIALATERCAEMGLSEKVQFMTADVCELPCDDDEFDMVFSECTLSLVPEKAKAFEEMVRVVKPGGRIVVSDIALQHRLTDSFKQDLGFVCCFSEAETMEEYQRFALQTGLEPILVEDHSIALKQTAFKVSQGYGSLDEFWTQFGQGKMPCCGAGTTSNDSKVGWKELFRKGRPGYWLMAWEKTKT